jgi:TRAP-type C4-dicarboxylate transport system permease large subunit
MQVFTNASKNAIYVMALVASAGIISYLVAEMRAGEIVVSLFSNISQSKWVILTIVNIFFLIWGTCMSSLVGLIVIVPILMPLLGSVGVDPVHFGVVVVLNLMIALYTPPIGVSLFLSSTIAKADIKETIKETPIFLIALLVALATVTYFPKLSLWLPGVVMGYSPVP